MLKDHLGSASVVTNKSGNTVGEDRFYPFGETRFTTGTMYTDKLFTGQREMAGLGIYHYGARFYSPKLGRFLSADSVVPGYANPQNLNRFSYVRNNPLRYTDPTGHWVDEGCGTGGSGGGTGCYIPPTQLLPPVVIPGVGRGGGRNVENVTVNLPADIPCGGHLDCNEPLPIPFDTEDVCDAFHVDPGACDPSTWGGFSDHLTDTLDYAQLEWSFYTSPSNLNRLANDTQDLATAVDLPFAVIEVGLVSTGCMAGPPGCGAGFLLSWEAFNMTGANGLETGLSTASWALTLAADFTDDGVLGEATQTSTFTFLAGGMSWDPVVDFAIDSYASSYNDGFACGIDALIFDRCGH